MGVEPPFMYDAVGKDSPNLPYKQFDPKAVSRASLAPKAPRPKRDGPLVASTRNSFVSSPASTSSPNRNSLLTSTSSPTRSSFASVPKSKFDIHPDSWEMTSYGRKNAKTMRPSTKKVVTRLRIAQLVLRCLQSVGAVGLLVITILISNIPTKIGLLIRIPPGVAILHTFYAIHHLRRRPSGRTPGSSASYMFFAGCFDLSLIPFYIFTALLSSLQHAAYQNNPDDSTEWSTLLPEGRALLPQFSETAFLTAIVTGGLQLISLGLSIWLGILFWKINNLPPDMNPLEDNLTSRRKKSRTSTTSLSAAEKRLSQPLESQHSSGAAYENLLRPPSIPFHLNRTGSTESFSTYHSTPPPSRDSQSEFPRTDLAGQHYQVPSQNLPPSPPKRASYVAVPLSDDNLELRDMTTATPPKPPPHREISRKDAWFGSDSLVINKKPTYEPIAQQSFEDFNFSFRNSPYISNIESTSTEDPYEQIDLGNQSNLESLSNPSSTSLLMDRTSNRRRTKELSLIREESRDYSSLRLSNSTTSNTSSDKGSLKGKFYGDLKPGTPPIIVGGKRQISTGADVESFRVLDRRHRDVSGKIAEEGRGGWGERLRRVSGRA